MEPHFTLDKTLAAIHETMAALENIGAISKITMREFDEACLQPVHELKPEAIRALREREHLSQSVFASYLNISKNLVSDWERGKRRPGGPALKLLNVIEKHGISIYRTRLQVELFSTTEKLNLMPCGV